MAEISSDNEDEFENLEYDPSQIEEISASISPVYNQKPKTKEFSVQIALSKNEIDLSIVENQYYQVKVLKNKSAFCPIFLRRFSDFALLYDVLFKKNVGYIFPAFPQNGLFAYMKTKVSVVKDEAFTSRRIKVIERFLTEIFNSQKFNPDTNDDIKAFISDNKYQLLKKIQKQKSNGGLFGFSFAKLKNVFTIGKDNKYADIVLNLNQMKKEFEKQHEKIRETICLMKDELDQDAKLSSEDFKFEMFSDYTELLKRYNEEQMENLRSLNKIEFEMFCQNEDILMIKKLIDHIDELKLDEQNYKELRSIEELFNKEVNRVFQQKYASQEQLRVEYTQILEHICEQGRF